MERDYHSKLVFWKITRWKQSLSLKSAKFCFKSSKLRFWSFARNPTPPGQPPPRTAQLSLPAPRVVRDVFALVSAGPEGSILEPRLASSSSPLAPCPRSGFKLVPLELPSCIRFLLELLNVTLEGAAAPQASSSPPPFAVVGCKSRARRQVLLGSQRGPCARLTQTDKPARRESVHAGQPVSPTPAPATASWARSMHFTRRAWARAAATAVAPFQSPCAPTLHLYTTPLLYVRRSWQVFFFLLFSFKMDPYWFSAKEAPFGSSLVVAFWKHLKKRSIFFTRSWPTACQGLASPALANPMSFEQHGYPWCLCLYFPLMIPSSKAVEDTLRPNDWVCSLLFLTEDSHFLEIHGRYE